MTLAKCLSWSNLIHQQSPTRTIDAMVQLPSQWKWLSLNYKSYSTTKNMLNSYNHTISKLRIGAHTRVIFQGFTGRQASANAQESIAYGTNIVGGVRPGKRGEHLGLPVLPTVREAVETLKPDATGIYVAAHQAAAAIEEAVEAQIGLIVAVAEHIPVHDMLRIHSILRSQSISRLVGANAPGIISAIGKCRIGFQPLSCFSPGCVGIIAKSGTLSYEAVASTTRAGLGQSLCIGMGGDVLAGTSFVDALKIFEKDEDTKGIILIGEIGGEAEVEAADWIREYRNRTVNAKPIAALIGGIQAAPGRVMGHAGAFTSPGEPDALIKIRHLRDAGCVIVNHPERFGDIMKHALSEARKGAPGHGSLQRRGVHTVRRTYTFQDSAPPMSSPYKWVIGSTVHKRNLYIAQGMALGLLRERGINASEYTSKDRRRMLAIGIDRASRSPCILASPAGSSEEAYTEIIKFPFDYRSGFDASSVNDIADHLELDGAFGNSLHKYITNLVDLFMKLEAFVLETMFVERHGEFEVVGARFGVDDAAFKSSNRHRGVHALRRVEEENALEVEAETDGIVYIRLAGNGNIGTLVNGAGLAMNTIDALADVSRLHGDTSTTGPAANFLDTGGKATSETVKRSFQIILQDERVKVIFVNVFGGLTRGDMIANGILLAFQQLNMKMPVIVRIRGTNETEGQKIIADSGIALLHAFNDFEAAAVKAIELANQGS